MQHRPKSSLLFLALLLFSQAVSAATLFPNRSRGWNKIPTIVVLGREGDSRNQLVNDAVDFWNKQLTEIGSGFRLGPVTFISEIIPPAELAERSRAVLDQQYKIGGCKIRVLQCKISTRRSIAIDCDTRDQMMLALQSGTASTSLRLGLEILEIAVLPV
jgi:hypothetical protein